MLPLVIRGDMFAYRCSKGRNISSVNHNYWLFDMYRRMRMKNNRNGMMTKSQDNQVRP
jgi:hypothetical protein